MKKVTTLTLAAITVLLSSCVSKADVYETTVAETPAVPDTAFETTLVETQASVKTTAAETEPEEYQRTYIKTVGLRKGKEIDVESLIRTEADPEISDIVAECKRQLFEHFIAGDEGYAHADYTPYTYNPNGLSSPDDIAFFDCRAYDFDRDGKNEYIIILDFLDNMGYNVIYYADDGEVSCVYDPQNKIYYSIRGIRKIIDYSDFFLIIMEDGMSVSFESYDFVKFDGTGMFETIFTKTDISNAYSKREQPTGFSYNDGIYSLFGMGYETSGAAKDYIVCLENGEFASIACDEIPIEEFCALNPDYVPYEELYYNGKTLKASLTKAYTNGYFAFAPLYTCENGDEYCTYSSSEDWPIFNKDWLYIENVISGIDITKCEFIDADN